MPASLANLKYSGEDSGHGVYRITVGQAETRELADRIMAVLEGDADIIKPADAAACSVLAVLLESGFDPDHGRWTIDDLLRSAAVENTNPEVVKMLLARGAEIDSRDENGMTALMKAAMRNRNPEVIMTLLRAGADPSLRSYDDMTAFDYMKLFNGNMERWDNRVWQIVKEACS